MAILQGAVGWDSDQDAPLNRTSSDRFSREDPCMRADRLVATLLLLQRRGQATAAEVAEELEVSERTARRDLEALGLAGLPIYSVQGRGGGWRLAGEGRTDLSGLSAAEARALFLVAGPSSTATPDVRAALRKLVRALPEGFRAQAEAASAALVVDPRRWDQDERPAEAPPHLDALQDAVIDGVQVDLGYVARGGEASRRRVHPLGLVSKGRSWYLVAGTEKGQRTFRVDRVTSVDRTEEPVERPPGFDLAAVWGDISDAVDDLRLPLRVEALVDARAVRVLRWMFGSRVTIGSTAGDGRVAIEVRGHHVHSLAGELAGLGSQVEVLGPPEVRARLAEVGAELVARYAG
jgi:predicted DNA-binding transcriptional regulator YafY